MRNEFTAIIERDGDWFIAYSPEAPGANGQGRTMEEARASLAEAIELILEDRRGDALCGVLPGAIREPEGSAPALDELLVAVVAENLQPEWNTGPAMGREVW